LHLNINFYVKGLSEFGINIISTVYLYPGNKVPFNGKTENRSPSLARAAAVATSGL
jgi:hypothetical protein